jgi:hypothetical protein
MTGGKLTPKAISILLAVDPDTVIKWHRQGVRVKKNSRAVRVRLSAYKIGGRWFIPTTSLTEFLRTGGYEIPGPLARVLGLPERTD